MDGRGGTRGKRTGSEKIFTSCRGCANLQEGVPGKGQGADGARREW